MPMSPNDVRELVSQTLYPEYLRERRRLERIDNWYRWRPDPITIPRGASAELKMLAELSKTPWLGLVVAVISQSMFADGFKSPDDNADNAAWRTWQGNKFDMRQVAIHKAALAYGYAYNLVLPGLAPDGTAMASMRGVSPRDMFALYGDPVMDDWPQTAIRVVRNQPKNTVIVYVYDEEAVYTLSGPTAGGPSFDFVTTDLHDAGVCPVVRYASSFDLEGRADGEVEPFIPVAARINKTDYDRLMTQHFASWRVITATGMARPDSDAEAAATKMRLRQDSVLIGTDPEMQFGVLPASDLTGFIAAHDSDVETLAAVTQTPTNALNGKMVNVSAEALASIRAQLDQKVAERKTSFGESHAQSLRLAAQLEGNDDAASDVMSRITWQDMSIRSLASAADALGKMATMLQVPVESLWSMIPGVTKADTDDWKATAQAADPLASLTDILARQSDVMAAHTAPKLILPGQVDPTTSTMTPAA